MPVEQELQTIRTQLAQANQQRARAEASLDAARAKQQEILAELNKEFGVATLAAANELLGILETEINQDLEEIKKVLEAAK